MLEWTIENIVREGDEVHLLHVIPVPMPEVSLSDVGERQSYEGLATDHR